MRKKVVSAILCASMVAGMVVIPGVAVKADDKKLIGVTMPTKDLQRWNQDGENMKKELEAAGYEVDLQYASNDVSTQVSQLENQVANGCDLLVVASIDGSSLGEPLKQAKDRSACQFDNYLCHLWMIPLTRKVVNMELKIFSHSVDRKNGSSLFA